MRKTKIRSSVVVLFVLTICMFALGVVAMSFHGMQSVYATTNEIAVDMTENRSGAAIRTERKDDVDAKEGIRFSFEISKAEFGESGKFPTGTADVVAEMLFIPTEILTKKGATVIRKDNPDLAYGQGDYLFETVSYQGQQWSENGDNYKFVACLNSIPKNFYDFEISAVMCFTKDSQVEYSQTITRSMRQVARVCYDNTDDETMKSFVSEYLKYYSSNESVGDYFSATLTLDGQTIANDTDLYYGDAIDVSGADISEVIGWVDVDGNYFESLDDVKFSYQNNVYQADYKRDGVVYYDGEGTEAFVLPNDLESYKETITLAEKETYTPYVIDGEAQVAQNLDITSIQTKEFLVLNNDVLLGTIDFAQVSKLITQASDLSSLYIDKNSQDYSNLSNDEKKSFLQNNENGIRGYYLVVNDILWANKQFTATPAYHTDGLSSRFLGTLDGNGKTIEYGIGSRSCGLLGSVYGGTIKNVSLKVMAYSDSGNLYNALGRQITTDNGLSSGTRSKIDNVYLSYGIDISITAINTTTTRNQIGLGHAMDYVDVSNTILNYSNVTEAKAAISAMSSGSGGLGALANTYTSVNKNIETKNVRVIWDNEYLEFGIKDGTVKHMWFAENDEQTEAYTNYTSGKDLLEGIFRYSDMSALYTAVQRVDNFVIEKGAGDVYSIKWSPAPVVS